MFKTLMLAAGRRRKDAAARRESRSRSFGTGWAPASLHERILHDIRCEIDALDRERENA